MSFDVAAGAYDRFMGRFSAPLAALFADFSGIGDPAAGRAGGRRVLDVGCGPGALTALLVDRLGPAAVSAADPAPSFVDAVRERCPGVDVRRAGAEALPFEDGAFDVTAAQLVVPFMGDPVAGLTEMARVTRPGGRVTACAWDHAGGAGPLAAFWRAVHDLEPAAVDESAQPGTREGHLEELLAAAGLDGIEAGSLRVVLTLGTFDDWWEPFTLGVGPAGSYVAGLDPPRREALRQRCAELLPAAPFEVPAVAWAARASVPAPGG